MAARRPAGALSIEDYPRFSPLPGDARWPHVSKWNEDHWRHWMVQGGASEAAIEKYLRLRDQYGVSMRAPGRGQPTKWVYRPTPKQLQAHLATQPNLLYGGAAGGAKSHWLRWDFHKRALYIPNYTWLILRRTFPELERTHMRDALREQALIGGKLVDTEFRYPNGSLGEFGHCSDEAALARWLSSEYDCIGIDEAATFPRDWLLEIFTRARTTKDGIVAMTRATSNPGGAHTRYLVDRYIDHTVAYDEDPFYDPVEFGYIPAKLWDNPWLMDRDGSFKTYIRKLSGLQPERRRQLLDGDWDALTGQFFPELARHSHQVDWEVGPGIDWERWVDWGYNAPGVCYWVACLPDARLYVRLEWKFQGLLAADVADGIRARTEELGRICGGPLRIRKTVVDPSMFSKTGHWGESMAETFLRRGVPCMRGDNQRDQGWQRLRHWFKVAPDGRPWLVTHASCVYFWRTLPALVGSKTNPEDLDTEGEDHAADACFVAGTLVSTPEGERQIDTLKAGDLVDTREGPRPVLAAWETGVRPVVRLSLSNGRSLTVTPNHPVWVEGPGFIPVSLLRYGDTLSACPATTTETLETPGAARWDRSQEGSISTTLTGTPRTTTSRIWSASQRQITRCVTSVGQPTLNTWRAFGRRLLSGTAARLAAPGISVMRLSSGGTAFLSFEPASTVTESSQRSQLEKMPASARTTASLRRDEPVASTMKIGRVSCADSVFESTDTSRQRPALGPAPRVLGSCPAGTARVYNLAVADVPEYFANGILVHNCRYGVMARPSPTRLADPSRTPLTGTAGELLAGVLAAQARPVLGADAVRGH